MELKIVDGDYTKDSFHDIASADGSEEVAERIMAKLVARRGGFAILPDFGSQLYKLSMVKTSERLSYAKQYIAEALSDENIEIDEITVSEADETIVVGLSLTYNGESITLETVI